MTTQHVYAEGKPIEHSRESLGCDLELCCRTNLETDQAKFAKNLIYQAIHDTHFEPTFSTSDTFQVQILTEIYDKTRVYQMLKAEFRFFLVYFVPFSGLNFRFGVGHVVDTIKELRDWLSVLLFLFS